MIVHFFKPFLMACLFVLPVWIIVRTVIAGIYNRNSGIRMDTKREFLLILFITYVVSVLSLTLTPAYFNNPSQLRLNYIPFVNTYHDLVYMINLSNRGVTEAVMENILGNMILFIPMGILIPMLFPPYRSIKKVLIICTLLSFSIELTQYFIHQYGTYRTADIDDIILNGFGGFLGFILYRKILKNMLIKFDLNKNTKN